MSDHLPKLIGLIGASGAGKSTLAKMLKQRGYTVIPMSCVLKDMLRALGFTHRDLEGPQNYRLLPQVRLGGMSPREVAQSLGTQWAREQVHPDLLVNAVRDRLLTVMHKSGGQYRIVVDGIRFPNEWSMVYSLEGELWRVRNPDVEPKRTCLDRALHRLGFHPRIHESEYHWPDANADLDLWNTGPISDLERQLNEYERRHG